MIPKKIYYVWFGRNELPEDIKKNIESWKKYNPSFEIIQINEDNFDIKKYNFVQEAYKEKYWAFASDVARLDVIYNNGGFYFDTDVEMLKPLDNLTKEKSVWGLETINSVNSGLIIGAEKGDADLKNLLDIYSKKHFDVNKKDQVITTQIIGKYFVKQGLRPYNKTQILKDGTKIFASEYFAPLHWWGGGRVTTNTIAIQQYTKSWGEKTDTPFRQKMRMNLFHYAYPLFKRLKMLKRRVNNG